MVRTFERGVKSMIQTTLDLPKGRTTTSHGAPADKDADRLENRHATSPRSAGYFRHSTAARVHRLPASVDAARGTGVSVIAWMVLISGAVLLVLQFGALGKDAASAQGATLGVAFVALAGGAGLARKQGWGWWLTCGLLYLLVLQSAMLTVDALIGGAWAATAAPLIALANCLFAIVWLNRQPVMDAMQFEGPFKSVTGSRVTPATAAFAILFLSGLIRAVDGW